MHIVPIQWYPPKASRKYIFCNGKHIWCRLICAEHTVASFETLSAFDCVTDLTLADVEPSSHLSR